MPVGVANNHVDGYDEDQLEERLRLAGERETVDGDASGVGDLEGRGGEVVEVDWAMLLDGSRVLELLYRLEVCIDTLTLTL